MGEGKRGETRKGRQETSTVFEEVVLAGCLTGCKGREGKKELGKKVLQGV